MADADAGDEAGGESNVQVRIQYDGDWSGSIAADGSSRSVEGSGTTTLDVSGSPSVVSANAQKQADNDATLTIQILVDGEVVEESSTSAGYGVAQASTPV